MKDLPGIPYLPNQIILFGHPHRLEMILGERPEPGEKQGPQPQADMPRPLPLRLLARKQFRLKTSVDREQGALPSLPQPDLRELRLYRFEEDDARWIDTLQSRHQRFQDVIIERNYLTRAIPWTGAGSPWTGAGSPWTGAGSPWTGAGSPWPAGGSPWIVGGSPWLEMQDNGGDFIRERAEGIFTRQWAFGPNGVDVQDQLTRRDPTPQDGEGVVVGVFDTSPFPVTFTSVTVDMPPTPLTLTLKHPIPGSAPGACSGFAANHGFFVAGLIHALAPAAYIQLIRVLDDSAQGTLFTLVAAIYDFIAQLNDKKAVINLSLGFIGSDVEGQEDKDGPDLLRDALDRAHRQNIVTVAAAGNENDTTQNDLPAEFPARWDFVLGVAASDSKKQRACFSNQGDVMAPGGSGLKNCLPPAGRCHDEDCPYTLISLNVASYTGYGYGIGTSFAAPLAAGLAARLQASLDQIATGVDPNQPGAASQAVISLIAKAAKDNDGVIKATV